MAISLLLYTILCDIMKTSFYVNLCNALKIHPDSCVTGCLMSRTACTPDRTGFLVKMLHPFISTVITDVEMHNSFHLWDKCFSESKFLSFATIGFDVFSFLKTHRKVPCSMPFPDIVNQDEIDQFFSEKGWESLLGKYEQANYQSISGALRNHGVSNIVSQKKHLIHFALIGGLQCLHGTSLVLDFFDMHPTP
ncbi:hypothetical protein XU18_1563 [Perkinsela sp. CCAP 1560/4]|nr:hypothetical protein XU18_1563 [Perkinsela sp. CCAP 1560/4]|eukprot:KNH07793.1 hypothetical protein XU18_1563 [Perkinsela sp. CCAP 1560/4]